MIGRIDTLMKAMVAMIGVVSNPRAGKTIGNPARINRLKQILGQNGFLREAHTLDEMLDIAEEFRREGIGVVAIHGGDGTLHHALSAIISVYGGTDLPAVALLRGGTMNTIARCLGISGLSETILKRVVSTVGRQGSFEVVRTNTLEVNDRYGFIFGLGFPVSLLKAYYQDEGRGRLKTITVLLEILFSMIQKGAAYNDFFHPFEAEIWVEGEKLPGRRYTAFLGATVKEVGLGFKPTRRAAEREGYFQCLCTGIGPERMGLNALRVLLGMELTGERLMDRLASRAMIVLERPCDMQIDGEIFKGQREIRLSAGPTIRFIRPKP
jgi:diacylglycerol kinase (ATP)